MTTISTFRRHRASTEPVAFAAPWARGVLVTAALLLSYGALATTTAHVVWNVLFAVHWFAVFWLVLPVLRGGGVAVARTAIVLAFAYGATMTGVAVVRYALPASSAVYQHPPFGEHPVREVAGFPWSGVEGNGFGLGVERIPFGMGIDALLVNMAVFTLLFGWLLRRASAERLAALARPATVFALVAGLIGGWRLGVLFD
ncbi:MAG: hypothetical protein ABIP94_19030 [Planctomycetota bacterium]